jgi:hypothetical protein
VDCCTRTDTIHIGGGDPPVADFTWAQDPPGSTDVVFTNTSLNDDWNTWIFGSTIASGDSTAFSFQEYGHYIVGLIVGNDCGTDTIWQQVDVFPATGIAATPGMDHVTCFATAEGITVLLPGTGSWNLEVLDARGALVYRLAVPGSQPAPITGLPAAGVYLLRARQAHRIAHGRTAWVR